MFTVLDYAADTRIRARARARMRSTERVQSLARRLDWTLLLAVAGLIVYGLWAIGGITADDQRQGVYAAAGAVGMLVCLFVDPDVYRRHRLLLYALLLGLLLLVIATAPVVRGSQRWLDIGSSLVYAAALGGVLFIAGTRWLHLGVLAAVAAAIALFVLWIGPSFGVDILEDYQRERLYAFHNPSDDPGGASWNVNQSILAVGSGELDGRGVTGATQTNFDYLPEHETDFVFASLAEQRGFFGGAFLLALYLLVIWRALKIITVARDAFSAIVAGGIAVALLFQIAINVGMTVGMAPVTGIPL